MNLARSDALLAVLAEVMQWGGGLGAIYFTGALLMTIVQAHVGAIAGRANVMADLYEGSIPIIVCLGILASAAALGDAVTQSIAGGAQDATTAVALWRGLAETVVRVVILSVGASMAVGFATGVLGAQIGAMTGQPGVLHSMATRIGLVLLTGVLTLLAVRLAGLAIALI